jgi:G patch domain-containing protein 2
MKKLICLVFGFFNCSLIFIVQMLRKANEFTVLEQVSEHSRNGERNRMASKAKRATRQAYQSMKLKPSAKRSSLKKPPPSTKRTSRNEHRMPKYANQPLSFVSSGAIRSEGNEIPEADNSLTTTYSANQTIASSVSFNQIGQFEAHTRGFGSRMLAKMGFIEGNGLGKDSQGIAQPLQAVMRPKSLGLGA